MLENQDLKEIETKEVKARIHYILIQCKIIGVNKIFIKNIIYILII